MILSLSIFSPSVDIDYQYFVSKLAGVFFSILRQAININVLPSIRFAALHYILSRPRYLIAYGKQIGF